jgi:Zn-dependent protease
MRGIISRGGIIAGEAIFMLDLDPRILISRIFVLLTAFAVHEFAHAWTADRFGDSTPRDNGRLTLNPMAHLDVMGSLMLVFAGFGWAKPVPVNAYILSLRSSAALMWVALAGPASNFLMALVASIPFQLGLVSVSGAATTPSPIMPDLLPSLDLLLYEFVTINLLLMLFNLIPLAPLDGDKILYYLLPRSGQQVMDNIRPYGPVLLLILVFAGAFLPFNLIGSIIGPPLNALTNLLTG